MTEVVENSCPASLLSEVTDEYMAIRGTQSKKYYPKYLIIAGKVWSEIFTKTMWVTNSVWKELKAGDPYDYIDVPRGTSRIFSVNTVDQCGNQVAIYQNDQLNIIPQPTTSTCSCEACGCADGLCDDLEAVTLTTKLMFTISGVDYYEKTWAKYCPNGDVIEYKETPTKKYNDFIGDGGDFNDDYSNDYDIGSGGFSNFSIETVKSQKQICKLKTRPCGCPENTPENISALANCGCNFNPLCKTKKRCEPYQQNINYREYGEVKLGECGTKIYYKANTHYLSKMGLKKPTHLLVSYQTDGKQCDSEILVPSYANLCMYKGIDYFSIMFNRSYSASDRREAKYEFINEQNELIKFLNPLKLSYLGSLQDAKIRW